MSEEGNRHHARERALSLLYEAELKGVGAKAVLDELAVPADPYAVELVMGVADRLAAIDTLIGDASVGWTIGRLAAIDRQVLRMAVFELLEQDDVPLAVVIDEAVELVKRYSTDASGRFVNGVLSTLARQVRTDAEVSDPTA